MLAQEGESASPKPLTTTTKKPSQKENQNNNNDSSNNNYISQDIDRLKETHHDQPIKYPIVLQCLQCRSIVGDTCSVSDINASWRTITLQQKSSSIRIDDELITSMNDPDFGSTFHRIKCVKCSNDLGRMYRTTSPELDHWRGVYTFVSDNLILYELSAEMTVPADHNATTIDGDNNNNNQTINSSSGEDNTQSNANDEWTQKINLEISKLQKFSVFLYEKMAAVEEQLRLLSVSSDEAVAGLGLDKRKDSVKKK